MPPKKGKIETAIRIVERHLQELFVALCSTLVDINLSEYPSGWKNV